MVLWLRTCYVYLHLLIVSQRPKGQRVQKLTSCSFKSPTPAAACGWYQRYDLVSDRGKIVIEHTFILLTELRAEAAGLSALNTLIVSLSCEGES